MWDKIDKILCWNGWAWIKWPFSLYLTWFILSQIYYMNYIPNYNQKIIERTKNVKIEVPNINKEGIKLFDRTRMLR